MRPMTPFPRPVQPPLTAALAACALLALAPPPARAGGWQQSTLSGPMTTNDSGTTSNVPFADEWDSDMATDSTVESANPFIPYGFFDLPVNIYGSQSTLSGTGFDTTLGTYDMFGAAGNTCHEDSTASPVVTFTWVPAAGKDMTSDPPPKGPVYLLEQARAVASASGDPLFYSGSATADDGLGDKAVEMSPDTSQGSYKVSQGKRLVQRDGTGGR